MESNEFIPHAVDMNDYFGTVKELQISNDGESARYRIIHGTPGSAWHMIEQGKWQPIRITETDSYIIWYRKDKNSGKKSTKRLKFSDFIRIGTPWLPAYTSNANNQTYC